MVTNGFANSSRFRLDRFDAQQTLKGWSCGVLIGLVAFIASDLRL